MFARSSATHEQTYAYLSPDIEFLSRSSFDREIESELQSHVEMRIDDNLAHGMSSEHARRDALVRFDNPTAPKNM